MPRTPGARIGKVTKVENAHHGWKAKVEIRARVLAAVGPARAQVFDAFAGPGLMHREVWSQAAGYVGCDTRWYRDGRRCYVADNLRVLRAVDLAPFTVFDLDAYGSPWAQALIIAARRALAPGERIGLVLTEGTALKTRFSQLPFAMREAADLTRAADRGAGHLHDAVIARGLQGIVRRMRGRIVRQWQAVGTSGAQMRYIGLVVEGVLRG